MHELYELKDKLCQELEEYGSKEMTAGSLEVIDKLAHTIKNLNKIIESHEESEGYSSMGGYHMEPYGSYARRGRGRRTGANQYGSYARGGYPMEGYSRNDGMIAELRELMMEAPDERSKKEFQRFISKMESM